MIHEQWVFEDYWPPKKLPHRQSERKQLARALMPVQDGNRGEDVLIHGPSGVGKTVTTHFELQRHRQEAAVKWATLRCSSATRNSILYDAITSHPKATAVHPNYPSEELLRTLQEIVDYPYVLVLDEADIVPDLGILKELYQIPKLSVIAICHDRTEWLARLDDDVQDYFSHKSQIEFKRYKTNELVDILQPRVERGLYRGVVTTDQLEWIADEVAGVARYGIKSLYAAALNAEDRNHDRIQEEDIRDGFPRARRMIRESNLHSLPFGHQFVYELLRFEKGLVKAHRVHELYERYAPAIYADRDQDPVGERMVTQYLSKLVEYDLVRQIGSTRWVEYEVIDDGLEAKIEPNFETYARAGQK